MAKFKPEFYLYGEEGEATIYVKDENGMMVKIESYEVFVVTKQQNQVSSFEVQMSDIDVEEKKYIKELREIFFFSGGRLILKGRIQSVVYDSSCDCRVIGYGVVAARLSDKELIQNDNTTAVWDDQKRAQYDNVSAQKIAKELLSEKTDGEAPYIIPPKNEGLFAEEWGDVSIRYENANILNCISKLAEAINYEWSEESNQADYEENSISIAEYLPSVERATNSQQTFTVSGDDANSEETNKEKDISSLANRVFGLGYGDGINQIGTSCYNASETFSILSSDITDVQTEITLADASKFDSSGTIRIMEEQVTYSGKNGNILTGCVRGANNTLALPHRKTIFVEKHIEASNAEEESSIGEYGIMDRTIVDRSIINLETLELVVSKELLNKMEPIETITIIPIEAEEALENRMIGDLVTIVDADSDISGDYRIVSMVYTSDYGDLTMKIQCSNRSLTFIDQMAKAKEDALNLSKYMQGSTSVYTMNSSENCDDGYGCVIKTYIPQEAVAINHVKLSYDVSGYRGYSATTADESTHTHGIPSLSVSGTTTNSRSHYHDMDYSNPAIYGTFSNLTPVATRGFDWNHQICDSTGYSLKLPGIFIFDTDWDTDSHSHSHSVSATSTSSSTSNQGSAHNHGVSYGIVTGTNTITKMKIFVDGIDRTSEIEAKRGHTLSIDSTEDEIDLTDWIKQGGWHTIDVRPNGRCRIESNLWTQVFIESK